MCKIRERHCAGNEESCEHAGELVFTDRGQPTREKPVNLGPAAKAMKGKGLSPYVEQVPSRAAQGEAICNCGDT